MRILALLALLFLQAGFPSLAVAQTSLVANDLSPEVADWLTPGDAVPDTMSPWRYYPLAVGNAWEYRNMNDETMRIDIRRDSLIDGRVYYNWYLRWYGPTGSLSTEVEAYVRFDTTTSYVLTSNTFPYFGLIPCQFDGQPGEIIDCMGDPGGYVTWMTYDGVLVFNDTTIVDIPAKEIDGVFGTYRYAAEFGEVWALVKDGRPSRWLTFARINGQEFGAEDFPLSGSGPLPLRSGLDEIALWPNPFRGHLTAAFEVREPAPAHVEVVDIIGRVVARHDLGVLSAGAHEMPISPGALPPGSYVLRVTVGQEVITSRPVTSLAK